MGKIRQAQEKRERNALYALKFKKKRDDTRKKRVPKYANWCRTKGHPPNCRVMDCPVK